MTQAPATTVTTIPRLSISASPGHCLKRTREVKHRRKGAAFLEALWITQVKDSSLLPQSSPAPSIRLSCSKLGSTVTAQLGFVAVGHTFGGFVSSPSVLDSTDLGAPSSSPRTSSISLDDQFTIPSYLLPSFSSMRIMRIHRGVVSRCCHDEISCLPSLSSPSLIGADVLVRGYRSFV